jgi:hypothetical protein
MYKTNIYFVFLCIEDTYWKPDIVDQQEVLVKVMDTYGKVILLKKTPIKTHLYLS